MVLLECYRFLKGCRSEFWRNSTYENLGKVREEVLDEGKEWGRNEVVGFCAWVGACQIESDVNEERQFYVGKHSF